MSHGRKSQGWALEMGYPKDSPKDTFPRRAMSAGAAGGLFLVLSAYKQDLDYICRGPVQGFRVILTAKQKKLLLTYMFIDSSAQSCRNSQSPNAIF